MFTAPHRQNFTQLALLSLLMSCVVWGCTRSSEIGEPERPLSEYGAFPATDGSGQSADGPLKVTMSRLKSEVARQAVATVAFNKPMVQAALGEQKVDAPLFEIEPKVDGAFSWVGTRTAVFHPDKPFPPATRYTITVPKGTQSLDGSRLAEDFVFRFRTPFLKVWASTNSTKLKPGSKIYIHTNLPVDLADLKKALELTRDGKALKTQIEPGDAHADSDHSIFEVEPVGGFEFHGRYALTIDGALRAKGAGQPLSAGIADGLVELSKWQKKQFSQRYTPAGYRADFESYGDFEITGLRCGYQDKCQSRSSWDVTFSNPVDSDSLKKCVSFRPKPPIKEIDFHAYSESVYISPAALKQGESYTLTLSDRCRDVFGNRLKKAKSFSRKIHYNSPGIDMLTGFRLIEGDQAGDLPVLPISLENFRRPAKARLFKVPGAKLPDMAAYYHTIEPDELPKNLAAPLERMLGKDLKLGAPRLYEVDLADVLKSGRGAAYLDVYSPELMTDWDDGTRRTLVVITDLGITVKRSAGATLIWVTRLSTGAPVKGAEVGIWNQKGVEKWRGETDENGLVTAPIKTVDAPHASLITAAVGDDMSLLDLNQWNSSVAMYEFGVNYDYDPKAVETKSFIFTERGVYKAGDTVHIKGYIRLQKNGALGAMPADRVDLVVNDSRGKNVALETVDLSPLGGFSLDVALPASAALGTYRIKATPKLTDQAIEADASLKSLGSGDSGSFRVEAYRTPEFEVQVEAARDELTVGAQAKVAIQGRYLFGAPMRGAKVNWRAHRSQGYFDSQDFPEFSFRPDLDHHWYYDASPSRTLSDGTGKLSDDGLLDIDVKIPEDKDFSGPQTVRLEADITDINRRQISGRTTIKVHPGAYYVGVRQADYLVQADATIRPQAVAVDHQGRALAGKNVTLRVVRREWKTEQKKNPGGDYSWVSTHTDTPVGACKVQTKAEPVSCEFKLSGAGSYRVLAESTDSKGHKLVGASSFYAYGNSRYTWERNDTNRIDLVADADKYKIGDVAKVLIKSPFERAHALVTVEQNAILSQFSTEISGTSAAIEIPVTARMQPNAFVSVSLIRGRVPGKTDTSPGLSDRERDPGRPAFKVGYVELKVDHSEKVLAVDITPDHKTYRPGGQVRTRIQLRDAEGAPVAGEVTLMAVDQGVLSLTGYKTPDPIEYFFASQPLGVSNFDTRLMLSTRADLHAVRSGMKSEAGGGGSGVATNYRSDFAAAATFKARVPVGEDGRAEVDFKLPDNLTSYRLMAVAVGAENRFGSADTRIAVNKPLMVRPSLPRFASTGDTFEARAVIQAMDDFQGKVQVGLSVDGALALRGEASRTITLKKGGNTEVAFPVVTNLPGEATIRFVAKSAADSRITDSVEMVLPVKYPAAKNTYLETGALTVKGGWSKPRLQRRIELPETMRRDVGGVEITLSSTRVGELLPGLEFLLNYPYGCSEQVTSRILPLISLRDTVRALNLPGFSPERLERLTQSGIHQLLARQTRDGGLGYWPGDQDTHDWASVYAALAMVRARADGAYEVDSAQYLKLIDYLRQILRQKTPAPREGARVVLATKAFATWVLAEAGAAEPAYHNELFEKRAQMPRYARLLLAMAMHRADATPNYRDQLLDEALEGVEVDLGGDGGAATLQRQSLTNPYGWKIWEDPIRQDAIALLALLRIRPNDPLVPKFAEGLLRRRTDGYWMSTQNTAFALMAVGEYFTRAQAVEPDYEVLVATGRDIVAREHFDKLEIRPRRIFIPMKTLAKYEGKLLTILRKGDGGPVYYTAKLTSAPKEPPTQAFDGGFHLKREYFATDGPNAGKPVDKVHPGQVLKVRLTLTVPEDSHYLAIEDPLPAGFEAINTAFETTSQTRVEDELTDGSYRGWWWSYWTLGFDYSAQHDDRIELFKSEVPAGIYRHAYLVRATTPGTFSAPAARVEAMYDPVVYGRSNARNVVIR